MTPASSAKSDAIGFVPKSLVPMPLHGTSKAYLIGRLRRTEGLGHLADAVEAGRITAHACALELGWIRRPPLLGGSLNQAKQRRFRFQQLLREARHSILATL